MVLKTMGVTKTGSTATTASWHGNFATFCAHIGSRLSLQKLGLEDLSSNCFWPVRDVFCSHIWQGRYPYLARRTRVVIPVCLGSCFDWLASGTQSGYWITFKTESPRQSRPCSADCAIKANATCIHIVETIDEVHDGLWASQDNCYHLLGWLTSFKIGLSGIKMWLQHLLWQGRCRYLYSASNISWILTHHLDNLFRGTAEKENWVSWQSN